MYLTVMSQSYKKECIYCKQEIKMTERLGRWYPSDLDGGIHYCDAKKKQQKSKNLDDAGAAFGTIAK